MRTGEKQTAGLLCCMILLLVTGACSLEYELKECPYNTRFVYYTCDGRSRAAGNYPIASVRQLVYDEQNAFVGEFANDTCQQGVATLQLPPGNYTLVAWANAPDSLADLAHAAPGQDRRGTISARPATTDPPRLACTAPLYYATMPFSVPPYGEASYDVGMMHAHARLNLTIEWASQVPEAVIAARRPVMTLGHVSACYYLDGGTPYGSYHFPQHHPDTPPGEYRAKAVKSADYKFKASFLTFRLQDEVPLALNLYEGELPLMKTVELSRYFKVLGIGLDKNLRQEFDLTVRISRKGAFVVETNLSGWEDGGSVGAG